MLTSGNKTTSKLIAVVFLFLLTFLFSFFFVDTVARAGTTINVGVTDHVSNTALGNVDPRDMAIRILNIAFTFLGMIAVMVFMYAGWQWMTSQGDAQKVDNAKKTIRNGVIGIVLIFGSYGIVAFIISQMFAVTGVGTGGAMCGGVPLPLGAYCCGTTIQFTPCGGGPTVVPTSSCGGYDASACPVTYLCPNSPGNCSVSPATSTPLGITCSTADCNASYPECVSSGSNCVYASYTDYNGCASSTNATLANIIDCELPISVLDGLGRPTPAYCDTYSGVGRWHINTSVSCPAGWVSIFGGKCVDMSGTCNDCSSGFTCVDEDGVGDGKCFINREVCTPGATCNTATSECEITDPASCDCCCRIASAGADCCTGLTCEGDCGTDLGPGPDTNTYGTCSGCRIESSPGVVDQAASDAACNCAGTAGKFCDVNADVNGDGIPEGRCGDCSVLSGDPSNCSAHSTSCCVDAENGNRCIGGVGIRNGLPVPGYGGILMQAQEATLSYCSYFGCKAPPAGGWNNLIVASSSNPIYISSTTAQTNCATSTTAIGAACYDKNIDACNPSCSKGYRCPFPPPGASPNCGYCCCDLSVSGVSNTPGDPNDTCRELNLDMYCGVDEDFSSNCNTVGGPTANPDRGTCCGCTADADCSIGVPDVVGCGSDACCHNRPQIASTTPYDQATDVCRNALIEATFTQGMSVDSFKGNAILLGDYGSDSCPAGTTFLSLNGEKEQGSFAKRLARIKSFFARNLNKILPPDYAIAYSSVSTTNNYCQIPGKVNGYHLASGEGVLTFSPTIALSPNTLHYMVLKGDPSLNSEDGIKNRWGIGMNTDNFAPTLPAGLPITLSGGLFPWISNNTERTFNGVVYENAYVWSFTTALDQGTGGGICQLNDVKLFPSSYLFQTNENDLNEAPDEDHVRDSDKIFTIQAKSDNGQKIVAIPMVYDWNWNWTSSYTNAADIVVPSPASLPDTLKVVKTGDVQNGKTFISSQAVVITDILYGTPVGTVLAEDASPVYVMLCDNPWPQVDPSGTWEPWFDQAGNCTAAPTEPDCPDTGYELYYCRDRAMPGTYDDLPAILDNATIRRGSFASSTAAKEVYYFRGSAVDITSFASGFSAISSSTAILGDTIRITWTEPAGVTGSTLYWGNYSNTYSNSTFIRNSDLYDNSDRLVCRAIGDCELSGLKPGVDYYLNVTFTEVDSGEESEYYGQIIASSSDAVIPTATSIVLSGTPLDGSVDLDWTPYTEEDVNYKLYYTSILANAAVGNYAEVEDMEKDLGVVIYGLNNGTPYYFALGIVDKNKNEDVTPFIQLTPYSHPGNVYLSASTSPSAVGLNWILESSGVNDVEVHWESQDGTDSGFYSFGGFGTGYEITGLLLGKKYDIWIRVYNTDGESVDSERITHQTKVLLP